MELAGGYKPLEEEQKREWEGGVLDCLQVDDVSCGVTAMSLYAPFVLFGCNRARAFKGSSGIVWASLFAIPMLLTSITLYLFYIPTNSMIISCTGSAEEIDKCRMHTMDYMSSYAAFVYLSVLFFQVFIIALGSWNRGQLRRKYKLPGSDMTDMLLWTFCRPCALSQEARTLAINNVDNGDWLGQAITVMRMPEMAEQKV